MNAEVGAGQPGSPFLRRAINRRMRMLDIEPLDQARPTVRRGVLIAVGFVAILALFALVAPFSSAAITAGEIVPAGDPLVIQPAESGRVSSLLVHEGDRVRKGQALVRLDPLRSEGRLSKAQASYDTLLAAEARLGAQLSGGAFVVPSELARRADDPRVAALLASERAQLARDRVVRQADQGSAASQLVAARAQARAVVQQRALIGDELASYRELYDQGFARKSTVRALQRSAAQLQGEHATSVSSITQARLGAQRLRAAQSLDVETQLAQVRQQLAQLRPDLAVAQDNAIRAVLRAPADGRVSGVSAVGPGAMVSGGTTLMSLVPDGAQLVADVSVKTTDIDDVRLGQKATLRLTSVNPHGKSSFDGHVVRLSPDRVGSGAASGYRARIVLDDPVAAQREGIVLLPGIPVSANIETRERTIFGYLFFAFTDAISRAFRSE